MKSDKPYTHPINLYAQKIKEEGIVVFDNVRGLPTGDKPFVSPDYVICIGHQGRIDLMYDDIADISEKYSVGVIFPNHRLRKVIVTDDYKATLIVVEAAALNDPMLQIINQMRYRYEPHPNVRLDKREYKMIMNVVEGMREITRLNLPDKRMLKTRVLEFLLRLLSHYRITKLNEPSTDNPISARFHSDLAQHFREHREVSFYAANACLSSKHFSSVIKKKQVIPPPIGFVTMLLLRQKCCSTCVATSPFKPSPICWASTNRPLSAAFSVAKRDCPPLFFVKNNKYSFYYY